MGGLKPCDGTQNEHPGVCAQVPALCSFFADLQGFDIHPPPPPYPTPRLTPLQPSTPEGFPARIFLPTPPLTPTPSPLYMLSQ